MAVPIVWTPKARAVLTAASELFYTHGISAVGVDTIAQHAGVTKKTLYDRFGSKERLVVEYVTERDRRWREFLAAELAEADPEPSQQILAVFDAAAAWARAEGTKGCGMINAHAEISDPAHPAYTVMVGQKRWMLEMFMNLARSAGHAHPQRVAQQIMMLHEGAVVTTGMMAVEGAFESAASAVSTLLAQPSV
ncbi:TetR/AcrR family transcriptional regulator [Nocardioides sp.]|uniref:TetR/AcrR family transcriptional regulator n=1 Tax=Nocardioides sp. TaxID=35761 RepID=UPI002735C27A|nr:TetR/AcrR family transcriptional regulator [Nocardioides sp.]MDP3892174.1 TetR/AcrR family transcriptional regulator [Nocardioides sp.]